MNIKKTIWTDADFRKMSWHDCKIYAISFDDGKFELTFDIDYIFEAVNPKEGESYYSFWVSPATLIFKNVYNLTMNVSSIELEIADITRDTPMFPKNIAHIGDVLEYNWHIDLVNGEISFNSVGYSQVIRQSPKLLDRQSIGVVERGGISFDRGGGDL